MNQIKTISKNDLNNFINKLIADKNYEVVGVKSKGKRFVFDTLENANELRLDHDVTIIPPKKYFLPQYERETGIREKRRARRKRGFASSKTPF